MKKITEWTLKNYFSYEIIPIMQNEYLCFEYKIKLNNQVNFQN